MNRLLKSDSPDSIPQSVFEQQLKLALEQVNQQAMQSALRVTEDISSPNPQLELARLEVMMQLAARAGQPENRQWLSAASQLTQSIENRHGGYWGRRAELILIGPAESGKTTANREIPSPVNGETTAATGGNGNGNGGSAELDLLIRLANNAMRNGRLDDAVKAFDRASQAARAAGADSQAFSLAVKASQALEVQKQYQQAANRLIDLANRAVEDPRSSAAHLRGCWNFSHASGDDPQQETKFTALLKQHLERWPQGDTADQARLWLAGQQQKTKDWQSAFENYIRISPASPWFGQAIVRAVYCAQRYRDTKSVGEQGAVAAQLTSRFKLVVDSTEPATRSKHQALLALTEFGIRNGSVDPSQLIDPLRGFVATATDPSEQSRGRAWLLVALLADPTNEAAASELLTEIGQDKSLLTIVEQGLEAMVRPQTASATDKLKQFRLRVVETALSLSLEEQESALWLYRKTDALTDLQRYEDALPVLAELESRFPADAGIQLRIARQLTNAFADKEPAKPLAKWRQLAAQLKPHSPSWYEAKFQVASLLEKSGQKVEARKLLEYLKAIPPGWENSALRQDFERLLAKCQ